MKHFDTLARAALAFLYLGMVLFVGNAGFDQQKTVKKLIVGTWVLDSVYDQTPGGTKREPWGWGVKGQVMFDSKGWMSFQVIAPDRSKTASNNPRNPVGQANCCFGTYTVDDVAKTVTFHIERCTFPQWDGADRTLNVAFPTENDLNVTPTKPIQDPSFGPFPHLSFKRAM
jgi:hypothetical protein